MQGIRLLQRLLYWVVSMGFWALMVVYIPLGWIYRFLAKVKRRYEMFIRVFDRWVL